MRACYARAILSSLMLFCPAMTVIADKVTIAGQVLGP